jgi:branched-chain amino acid transport system substrate-binding protein
VIETSTVEPRGFACSGARGNAMAPGTVQSQNTFKIGVPVPLSGNYMNAGTDILNGAKLAVARINKAGGVLGKHIELLPVDDACDADMAAQAAQKLVDACVVAVLPEARVARRGAVGRDEIMVVL